MAIHMGYMGSADIGGTVVKITSSSINRVQTVEAPELVQGDFVKKAVNYGKVEIGGNISGPCAENSIVSLWTQATSRIADGDHMSTPVDITIAYYKSASQSFAGCYINSFQLSVTAGEVAQFTIDFMGKGVPGESTATGSSTTTACEKLITWDKCSFTGGSVPDTQVQSYTMTVGNGLQRAYVLNQDDLYPADVLAGMQNVTGSVSIYGDGSPQGQMPLGVFGADHWDDYTPATDVQAITVTIGAGVTASANVMFNRPEANAATGPTIYTVGFTGVCTATA
jgi:hypothetical protein